MGGDFSPLSFFFDAFGTIIALHLFVICIEAINELKTNI